MKRQVAGTAASQSRRGIKDLRLALETARKQGHTLQVEDLLGQLGTTCRENGQPKLAVDAWQEAAAMAISRGALRECAALYSLIGLALLALNYKRRALHALNRSFRLFSELGDLPHMLFQVLQMAYLNGRLGYMQRSEELFRQARSGYRTLGDVLGEAVGFSRQAEVFWERSYHPADALGLLTHAILLFETLFWNDGIDPDILSAEQQRAQQLHERMQQERGEDGWIRLSRASAVASRRARGESDEDREQERHRLQDRAEEIEELGFLRHDRGRSEPQALAALSVIGEHGFNLVACSSVYQDLRTRLRRQHNRLAEAIAAGTALLIEQVAQRVFEWNDDGRVLLLYLDSGDQVGIARTLFNRGIGAALAHPTRLTNAFACVYCAVDAFSGLEQAGEKECGRRVLASWVGQMDADAVEKARTLGKEYYEQFFAKPRRIGLYRGRGTWEPLSLAELAQPSLHRYGEASHLLDATERVLAELIGEAVSDHPTRLEWDAYDDFTMLRGITTGLGLSGDPQLLEGKFRVRFLDVGVWNAVDPDDAHPDFLAPLTHRTRDGFDAGIHLVDREEISRLVLDYLDREYSHEFEGRAVEFLDSQGRCALQIGWLYNSLGTSWRN